MPLILLETHINAPIETVFDLMRNIDLHKLSAHSTKEEAVYGVTSGLIRLNETVTWKAKHLGVTQYLTVKITQFDYPNSFTDEMVKGAFNQFKHTHQFNDDGQGGTLVVDNFDYTSPFGLLGRFIDWLFLKRYMTNFLKERNRFIKEYAEGKAKN